MHSVIALLLLAALSSTCLAIIAWNRRSVRGARAFALLMLAVGVWAFGYALELLVADLDLIVWLYRLEIFGIVLVPAAWIAFTLQYSGLESWLIRRNLMLLGVEPAIMILLHWTNELHQLYWVDIDLAPMGSLTIPVYTLGPAFLINTAYSYILLAAGSYILLRSVVRNTGLFRHQAISLLIGVSAPWIGNIIYLAGLGPAPELDPTPIALTVSGFAISWGLLRYRFLELIPVARDAIISNMSDGVIVFDMEGRIIDLNPAAEKMILRSADEVIGKYAIEVFRNQPELAEKFRNASEAQAELSVGDGAAQRHYDLRISTLKNQLGRRTGRLVVIREITDRVKTEAALSRREAILEAVRFAAEQFLATSTWEETIPGVLEELGQAAGTSRVYIFNIENEPGEDMVVSQLYEWTAEGIDPQIDNPELQKLPFRAAGFARWENLLTNGKPVFGSVKDFPFEEQKILQAQQILSLVVVPIFVDDLLWGFIGFDECRYERTWSKAELDALLTAAGTLGSAIARNRADHDLLRRAHELATLNAISLKITAPHELPDLLQTIVEHATALFEGTGGGLYLCEPEEARVRCVVSYNTVQDYTGTVLKYGEGAAGRVALSGKPLIIDDYRTWPGRSNFYEEDQPFQSIISVPMSWQGDVLGVIHVLHDKKRHHFSQEDLKLLTLFANQASIAYHNAQMFEAAQQRAQRLSILNEMTRASLEIEDLDQIMQSLADHMRQLMRADGCYFTYWDERSKTLITLASSGRLENRYSQMAIKPGEKTMTESVLNAGHTLIAEDVLNSPYLSSRISAQFPGRALLAVPMIVADQRLGATLITFDEPREFTQDEIELAEGAAAQIALALAKTRLLEAERHRANVLDSLRANVADISSVLDLSDLLIIILGRAVTMLIAVGGDIGVYDEATGEIHILVSHNMGKDYAGTRLAPGEGAMGQAVQANRMVVIEDYQSWEFSSPQFSEAVWHATLAVPLRYREHMIGALAVVDSDAQRRFSDRDQQLLQLFAQQVSIAIVNARLYEVEKQRAAELQVLFEGSVAITNSIDRSKVLNTAAEQLARAVNATSAHVLSFDPECGEATVLAEHFTPRANGQESDSDLGISFDINRYPQTMQALLSGKPFAIRRSDPGLDSKDKLDMLNYEIKSALNVPMIASGQIIGYAEIWDSQSERVWDEEEIRVCQTLANQAAIALDNARIYDEMKRMAITDSLTGIYNRRGLFEMGEREVSRAIRFSHNLSAIMLDIDHFKKINDAYSHAAGDQVLQKLAQICRRSLRDIDILGRYGGEEFAVLLPETDCMSSYQAAERLRRIVADEPIDTQLGSISITISMGIACIRTGTTELAVLLDQADTAMYAAKEAGRNRIEVFDR